MNVGDRARLFAAGGEYERSTRNREVISGKDRCAVRLEAACEGRRETYNGAWRGASALHE